MDMSFGKSEDADYNFLLVMGKYRNCIFVVDAFVGRWTFQERLNVIQKFARKWPGIPLHIEGDFIQNAIVKEIKYQLPLVKIHTFTSKGQGMNYKDLYEGQKKAAKKGKIHDALVVPLSDQRVYMVEDLPELEMFKQQLVSFPNCEFFDFIDTLAMGFIILRPSARTSMAIFT